MMEEQLIIAIKQKATDILDLNQFLDMTDHRNTNIICQGNECVAPIPSEMIETWYGELFELKARWEKELGVMTHAQD